MQILRYNRKHEKMTQFQYFTKLKDDDEEDEEIEDSYFMSI